MLSDWIVVVDVDDKSLQQKEYCVINKPELKGMIDCGDIDNTSIPICETVTHFPAFCHIPTNSCVYGVRNTPADVNVLPTLIKGEPRQDEVPQSTAQPSTQTNVP